MKNNGDDIGYRNNIKKFTIHTDGGSRGNPGPAAAAFIVQEKNDVIFEQSVYLGKTTNNIAEYTGVLLALEWFCKSYLQPSTSTKLEFILDSELVVKQINGIYKVKDLNLRKIYFKIKEIINKNNIKVIFINVPREKNTDADFLVNKELDNNL